MDTQNWISQIHARDQANKDALLNYKRAARLPATLVYTTLVLALTGGLTYLVAQGTKSAELTVLSAFFAIFLTYSTFKDGMSPDMRYWENLPQAFFVTTRADGWKTDPCLIPYDLDPIQQEL